MEDIALSRWRRLATAVFSIVLGGVSVACGGGSSEVFAPRFPGAARAPTAPEKVQILTAGKPSCDYVVIGTIFTRDEASFARMAASVGGDGAYDSRCELRQEGHMIVAPSRASIQRANGVATGTASSVTSFQTTLTDCAARVFVCKGPGAAGPGPDAAAPPPPSEMP